MLLIQGLIQENATLSVEEERTAQDASGGSAPTWSGVATGVSAFFGNPSAAIPPDFHSTNERATAVLVSSSSYVGRSDVRFKITATTATGLSGLVNTYWTVTSAVAFPAGSLGLVPDRYEAKVSRYVVPS